MTSWINNISFSWFIIYICASDSKDSAIFHSVGRGAHIFPHTTPAICSYKTRPRIPYLLFFPLLSPPWQKIFLTWVFTVFCRAFNVPWNIFQFSSVTQSCLILCDPMDCSMPGLPVHHQLPELTQSHVLRVSDVIQPSHPLSSTPLLPSIFPSIRVFSNESVLRIGWPKYWSFSFNLSPSNEHPGLISFRMDWLDFLAVQGTLKTLFQHHSSKASILQHSAFFIVQLSHPYMTTGKTTALTRQTFVDKIMPPLFNILSMLVIIFLLRSKRLLISWLQSPSAVILAPKK